jgi:hypothetical protein
MVEILSCLVWGGGEYCPLGPRCQRPITGVGARGSTWCVANTWARGVNAKMQRLVRGTELGRQGARVGYDGSRACSLDPRA